MLCGVLSLPVPLEPILSYTCPAALRETKHTCPDSSGTTQNFLIILYWFEEERNTTDNEVFAKLENKDIDVSQNRLEERNTTAHGS